ncbi:MAG TPA: hypothetical protein VJT71_01435 [Pyrinomonadaceae bacterium]|nr:hypothetical protein [Pyrinomonadaceae bacterium]
MRRTVRGSISILVIMMLCSSVFEISVLAKKKPKRKRSRATAARTQRSTPRTSLPILLPPVIATAHTTQDGIVTKEITNKPILKTPKIKAPVPENVTATAGQLIISEFRFSGPGKPTAMDPGGLLTRDEDEFIEIYNASGASHTVQSSSGSGYAIVASDGVVRCTIANGEVIANKAHWLCANSDGFSISTYPDNDAVSANFNHTIDIPENSGIALFNNNSGNYNAGTRIDAVGSSSAPVLYREGAGYTPLAIFNLDYSFVRDTCGKGGNTNNLIACTLNGLPKDTDNNAADFFFIDTTGTDAGAGARLGTPGPQANFGPIERNGSMSVTLLDPCVSKDAAPNRVRDFTADPGNNSTFGTIDIRRTVTNNTGGPINRLRFRIVDMTTKPSAVGVADLRFRTSPDLLAVTVDRPPCGSNLPPITVFGTTLADRFLFMGPPFQPQGGGVNALIVAGTINNLNSLPNGSSVDVHFLLGIQQTGTYRFYINVEVFP